MKWLILVLALSCAPASAQIQQWNGAYSRIVNNTPYYMWCEIMMHSGHVAYWEMEPGYSTPWWPIKYWRCQI